ncbi:MAG: crotonase/enoyl-CoA hydratase family protein [Candidatus Hydrogenedentes bacterium]|nr:crotonase/enoyl-CoA hydratase family protein [Candidatus Hydrogenedentota bacterium]
MSERHPEGQITTEKRGHLYLVGIDRKEKYNGLTPKMFEELLAAYTTIENDDDIRVGILFAHGDHFTTGLDLPKFAESMRKGGRFREPGAVDVYGLERGVSKAMVCAIQGYTYTAGIEMMLACDIVIAASDCKFSQLEPKRGIMAAGGATIRFVQRGGWGNAMLHLLTCDVFDAQEAQRIGLVQEIVEPGRQLDRAIEIAELIAQQAPLAIKATKANALQAVLEGQKAAIASFAEIQLGLANSEDAAEGVASFVERRDPVFKGC